MSELKLNQVIAIEKGVKAIAAKNLTAAYHDVQKTGPLNGLSRTYSPKDEDGDKLPSESTLVQLKADEIIAGVQESITRLFDVTLTKETANAAAKADVKVGAKVIIKDAPVTYLLFLEKQLVDIGTLVSKLPVLDPSENWTYSSTVGAYAADPSETTRTKKIPRNHVLAAATDKHPAQVQLYHEDVVAGYWKTVKYSGALPADKVAQLATRVEQLKEAVKFAREEANSTTVEDKHAGKAVLDFIFKD